MHYDLMVAARKALAEEYESEYPIAYENVEFKPPSKGGMWLSFHYTEAETVYASLDRKCRYYVGMVQVNVIFAPGVGTDKARKLAKGIADFFEDGKILETGYISQGGEVRPVQRAKRAGLFRFGSM